MKESHEISSKQIKALIVTVTIGVGILSLPSKIARIQGTDGWIIIILGGLIIIPPLIIINKIFDLYPDKNFFEIGEEVLGKWIFKVALTILLFHFIILSALVTRHLGEIIKAFLLSTTPIEFIILTFILTSSYLARSDIHIIGRASYHIYPIIVGYIIIMSLISLSDINFTNMLPVFQSKLKDVPKSLGMTFFAYSGMEILLLFLPFAEDKENTLKASIKGIGIVIIIYTLIFIITLSQYGLNILQKQTFPTLSFVKEIDLPGFFIENLDGFVMGMWVIIIFATMAVYYYSAGKILSKIVNTKSHEMFIIPLIPIIYIISLIPPNIVALEGKLGNISNYTGIFTIIFVPTTIYLVGYFKVRRAKN